MTAGLLTQPRVRGVRQVLSLEHRKIQELESRVGDLLGQVSGQQKLIHVLKSIPGNGGREVAGVERKARRILVRAKAESGEAVEGGSSREPGEDGSYFGSERSDTEKLEKQQ